MRNDRIFRRSLLIGVSMSMACGIASAPAQTLDDQNICSGLTGASADVRVQACTRVIAAGNPADEAVAVAYSNRAHLHNRSGDVKKAIADMTQAIKLDPNGADAFVDRANYWIEQKNYRSAIDDCNAAIQIVEGGKSTYGAGEEDANLMALAYGNRGLAHLRMKQHDDAAADFHKALSYPAEDDTLATIRNEMSKNHLVP